MEDLLTLNSEWPHPALFKVDATTGVAFLSLHLETSRLAAKWLLIMSFLARFCGSCGFEDSDKTSKSDTVISSLEVEEESKHFSVTDEILLFPRSRNF